MEGPIKFKEVSRNSLPIYSEAFAPIFDALQTMSKDKALLVEIPEGKLQSSFRNSVQNAAKKRKMRIGTANGLDEKSIYIWQKLE